MNTINDDLHGINKLPNKWGMLIFPISMARIANAQSPDACLEYIRIFNPDKIAAPTIGLNLIYTESLYTTHEFMSSGGNLALVRNKFLKEAQSHKNRMKKIIDGLSTTEFQIPSSVNYQSWDNALLNSKAFPERLGQLKKIYQEDVLFQKYLAEDCVSNEREVTEAQVDFFLEEHLLTYLIQKGECYFHNNHVLGREEWILWCYPGASPKALTYLFQLNPFKLDNPKNKYQHCTQYDLTTEKLHDSSKITLS